MVTTLSALQTAAVRVAPPRSTASLSACHSASLAGAPVHAVRLGGMSSGRASLSVRASGGAGEGGGLGPRFDQDSMQVLGIPGVQISPEQPAGGGSGLLDAQGQPSGGGGGGGAGGLIGVPGSGTVADPYEDEEPDMSLELAWDPDGLLGSDIDGGVIARREAVWAERAEKASEEEKEEEMRIQAEMRAELEAFRESRVPELEAALGSPVKLVEFFMNTEFNEVEYEMTRCRPHMDDAFFAFLKDKFDNPDDDEALAAKHKILYESSVKYVAFVDANTKALAEPADRLRALLTAEDKKAKILEMAGNNEIDKPLMALLKTNINMAIEAEQYKPAEFMEKIYEACRKYMV